MIRRLGLALALIGWSGIALAQGGMGPGPGTVHSVAAGFVGPGDIVSGAYAWYSCSRGYNTADTANACNVCLPADVTCADLTLSGGFAVVPAGLSTCNITTVICTVKTAYDKSGNARDVTMATEANRPTFRPAMASNNCPTTALPCMLFTAASSQRLLTASTFTVSQQVTISVVFNNSSSNAELFGFATDLGILTGTSGTYQMFSPSGSAAITATNATWHASQNVFNTTSSAAYVDGSTTSSLNPGTGGATARSIRMGGPPVFSSYYNGYVAEAGIWNSGFNATQAGDVNTNQHGANGYNF